MRTVRAFWRRVNGLFGKEHREREFNEEMEAHLQMQIQDNMRSGMTAAEARRIALVGSGGLEFAREAYRDRRGLPWLEHFLRDARYALRSLRKNPSFTLAVLLTLALGIGANTAIFSLLDAFLLRPLPVKDPRQLVVVRHGFPYSTFEQFRDRNHSFSGIFAYDETHVTATIDGVPEYIDAEFASGNYFDVLGVGALAGRTLRAEDDQPGRQPLAVISYRYWDQRFGRELSAIGKTIYLAGTPFTIVGVTPPAFLGRNVAGKAADIVLPMFALSRVALKDHDSVSMMARLKPHVSMEQARADLDVLYRQIQTAGTRGEMSPRVQQEVQSPGIELRSGFRGTSDSSGEFATELRILAAVAGMALLIVCVNVGNLLLARGAGRQKEVSLRLAIGASRGRLIRQFLTESAVLAAGGGILGLVFAKAGLGLLVTVLSYGKDPIPFDLSVDTRVLAFTGALSLLTGMLFGLAPAFAVARVNLAPILRGAEDATERRPLRLRLINLLVVLQVTLSLVLLVASGLMVRSLRALHAVDFGFEGEKVLVAWVFPALAGYDHAREMNLYRDLPERLSRIAGVQSASLLRVRMLRGGWYRNVWAQSPEAIPDQARKVRCDSIGPRFFETMGIGLASGREFSPADSETAPKVAIVSQAMARKFFPHLNPIGLHIGFGGPADSGGIRIVGVAHDVRHRVPEDRPGEAVYIPYTQAPPAQFGQMNLMVRTFANPPAIIAAMRREIQSIDGNLPLVAVQTQAEEIGDSLGGQRSLATLLSIFGALALSLAAIGLYGTMAYTVGRRTRELGIRIALGAEKGYVLRMVLRQAMWLVLIGAAIGIPAGAAATRLLASMLFSVKTTDPVTILAATVGMFAVAALAAYIPARRASQVDPIVALRYE